MSFRLRAHGFSGLLLTTAALLAVTAPAASAAGPSSVAADLQAVQEPGAFWSGCQPIYWPDRGCAVFDMVELDRRTCTLNGDLGEEFYCAPQW